MASCTLRPDPMVTGQKDGMVAAELTLGAARRHRVQAPKPRNFCITDGRRTTQTDRASLFHTKES